jgi:predicted ester cyclase
MKELLFLTTTFLFGVICNIHPAYAQTADVRNASTVAKMSQEEKEERNKKIALANAEAIHAHDIDAASKNFASDIINYGNGAMPPQKGIEAVTASLRMFTGAFPIDKIDKLVAVADGDWVMLWGKWSGTWKGDFMGQKATGKSFTKPEVEIYRFNEEGKIIEHHSVQSLREVARQIEMRLPGQ